MARVLIGFLLAPIVPTGVMLLVELLKFGRGHSESLLSLEHAFVLILFICWLTTIVAALPLYILCWAAYRVNLSVSLISGALIGAAVVLLPLAVGLMTGHSAYTYYQSGSEMLIANGHYTAVGIQRGLESSGWMALYGAAIGGMFWLIGIRNNARGQSRRDFRTSIPG